MFWHIVLYFSNIILCCFICYSYLLYGPCFLCFYFLWCLSFNISKALFFFTWTNFQSQEGNDLLSTQSSTLSSPHISQSLLILADVLNSDFFSSNHEFYIIFKGTDVLILDSFLHLDLHLSWRELGKYGPCFPSFCAESHHIYWGDSHFELAIF